MAGYWLKQNAGTDGPWVWYSKLTSCILMVTFIGPVLSKQLSWNNIKLCYRFCSVRSPHQHLYHHPSHCNQRVQLKMKQLGFGKRGTQGVCVGACKGFSPRLLPWMQSHGNLFTRVSIGIPKWHWHHQWLWWVTSDPVWPSCIERLSSCPNLALSLYFHPTLPLPTLFFPRLAFRDFFFLFCLPQTKLFWINQV